MAGYFGRNINYRPLQQPLFVCRCLLSIPDQKPQRTRNGRILEDAIAEDTIDTDIAIAIAIDDINVECRQIATTPCRSIVVVDDKDEDFVFSTSHFGIYGDGISGPRLESPSVWRLLHLLGWQQLSDTATATETLLRNTIMERHAGQETRTWSRGMETEPKIQRIRRHG